VKQQGECSKKFGEEESKHYLSDSASQMNFKKEESDECFK
jgi:hypothetical protein